VTKNYVDTKDINSFPITSNGLGIGGYRIYNLGSPINSTDAANKSYVDNKTFDINSNTTGQLSISRLSGYPSSSNAFLRGDGVWILPYINNLNISSDVSFANYRIVNLANPINSQDAVTKNYADTFTLSPSRISGYPSNSSYFLRGDGAWATPSGGGGSPYTGKFVFQESGYQIYIRASSNFLDLRAAYVYAQRTSAILETNSNNETCSLVMNGDFMQFINPIDTLGFIFTDEDNDPQTTYVGYIDNSGFHTSCSKDRKHSIRKKQHKNYLERLNKLSIYSYGLKYQVNPYDSDKKKKRKIRKMNELQVGVIAEEVAEIFDNATNQYKPLNKSINERPPDNPSLAVNYNTLLCYSILAIQELAKKVEFLEQKLEKAYNLQS
jgi:hypothetical protein